MKLKTFKEFINEDFRTTLPGKGVIESYIDNGTEINFYYEKIKTINLREYLATFMNKNAYDFLTHSNYGRPDYFRFLLFYYNNSFTIYVFNGNVSHINFVELLDSPDKKPKWINIKSFSKFYLNIFSTEEEKNKLEELNTMWCLPGLYKNGIIKSNASSFYINLLAQLGFHEKLGFDDDTWKSLTN
jgi:hypothetical protein